jgi:hypothetical protein
MRYLQLCKVLVQSCKTEILLSRVFQALPQTHVIKI